MDAPPVSPLPQCIPTGDVDSEGGGVAHEELDEVVRHEDAELDSVKLGKRVGQKPNEGIRPLPEPDILTDAEMAKHMLTHLPYHNGCKFCIQGRRPNNHHRRRRSSRRARRIPCVSADYGFIRTADDGLCTFLAVYIRPFRIYFAIACDVKGSNPSGSEESGAVVRGLRAHTLHLQVRS